MSVLYPDLADPTTPPPLLAAVSWVEQTALGSVATSVAVIAVAVVGLLMLRGRLQVRRGATVITGCFILFGAPALATGIREIVATVLPPPSMPMSPSAEAVPSARHSAYDPDMGAAVPQR